MTYDSIDESTAEGRPLYLYRFTEGPQTWRFTSRAVDWVSPAGAVAGGSCRQALLRKRCETRTSPFPRHTYPTGSVTGIPSAV